MQLLLLIMYALTIYMFKGTMEKNISKRTKCKMIDTWDIFIYIFKSGRSNVHYKILNYIPIYKYFTIRIIVIIQHGELDNNMVMDIFVQKEIL